MLTRVFLNGCRQFLPTLDELSDLPENTHVFMFDHLLTDKDLEPIISVATSVTKNDATTSIRYGKMTLDEFLMLADGEYQLTSEYQTFCPLDVSAEDQVYIVDYTSAMRTGAFEQSHFGIMERFNTGRLDNCQYLMPTAKMSIEEILASKVTNFNPFNRTEPNEAIRPVVKELMFDYVEILYAYVSAGFHRNEIRLAIPHWNLNLEGRALSLFINYFRLFPTSPDKVKFRTYEFGQNSQYRRIVTEGLMKVVYAYAETNGIKISSDRTNPQTYYDFVQNLSFVIRYRTDRFKTYSQEEYASLSEDQQLRVHSCEYELANNSQLLLIEDVAGKSSIILKYDEQKDDNHEHIKYKLYKQLRGKLPSSEARLDKYVDRIPDFDLSGFTIDPKAFYFLIWIDSDGNIDSSLVV